MSNRRKIPSVDLLTTGVVATSYGSATAVPVITFNAQGQATSATTVPVSPDTTITVYSTAGIAAGQLVYLSSYNVANSCFEVLPADADAPASAATYIIDSTIAAASTGTASKTATLTSQNTAGATVGDPWYLSGTAGAGTLTPPTGADQIQQIVGRVVVVNAATGQVAVDLTAAPVSKAGTSFIQTSVGLTTPKITTSINDANGNESLRIAATASAVNEFTVTNAATGNGVSILATGDDTNISVQFGGKGNGAVVLGQATSTDVRLAADQPIADSSGNEFIKFSKTASAVNEVTVTNAATSNAPKVAASGGDANVRLDLSGKGTGGVTLWSNDGAEEILILADGGSAVNEVTITSAATGAGPSIAATGGDTNVPITLAGKGTGKVVIGQATSASLELGGLAAGSSLDINDAAGNEALTLSSVASAVNEFTVSNAATGSGPSIAATGGDTNIPVTLAGKGTGKVTLGQATSASLDLAGAADAATFPILGAAGTELLELFSVASAVNQVGLSNADTGNGPQIRANGDDTNIDLKLVPKGTGSVVQEGAAPQHTIGKNGASGTVGTIQFKDGQNPGNVGNLATAALGATKTWTLPAYTGTVLAQENSSPSTGNVVAGSATVTSGGNSVTVNVGTQFNSKPVLLSIATDSAGAYVGAGVSMIVIGTVAAGTLTIQVRDAITGNTANVSKNVDVFYMISAV